LYNKLSFYQDRDRLGTNIIGELQKEIRVFSEEIEFEVLEEDEEELPPAAAAAAAVGFAGAASAGVVRAPKRSLLPRGQRSVYRELARLHCAIVAKRQHARTPYIEDLCLHVLPHKVEKTSQMSADGFTETRPAALHRLVRSGRAA
jgi:hypothetical protein